MTTTPYFQIRCNADGCRKVRFIQALTPGAARGVARHEGGWRSKAPVSGRPSRDYCDEHAADHIPTARPISERTP